MQLRGQLLSALVAASFDHVSAGFGAHSFAKTVNFATLSLFGLIRSFHDTLLMILYKNSIAIRVARRFFGNALIFFACHTIKRANKVYTITARRVKRNSRTIPRVVSVAVYGKRNAPTAPLAKAWQTLRSVLTDLLSCTKSKNRILATKSPDASCKIRNNFPYRVGMVCGNQDYAAPDERRRAAIALRRVDRLFIVYGNNEQLK